MTRNVHDLDGEGASTVQINRDRGAWRLSCELWLPRRRREVFGFFADAHNLEKITPPLLRFEVLTPAPIEMRAGALIDYRLRLHGLPIRWRTRIAIWEPPHRFVDEQIRGPYRLWRHEHRFADENGGTRCTDRVAYRVSGGPLAPAIHALFVRKDLRRIFEYRRENIERLLA